GPGCDGQVLVLHDMLGIISHKPPRFVKDFLCDTGNVAAAVAAYIKAVKDGSYPGPEHRY
ncbi:MAG: 3-methyl-2-oxobutanoate hydroxymethyltransferase, partial [Gammaproteobacteria bacterium]